MKISWLGTASSLVESSETKLLFVPLCGERFTWKDGEKAHGTV